MGCVLTLSVRTTQQVSVLWVESDGAVIEKARNLCGVQVSSPWACHVADFAKAQPSEREQRIIGNLEPCLEVCWVQDNNGLP